MDLDALQGSIGLLDSRIRPIAGTPVDITEEGWLSKLTSLPHPLDQAGVRKECEALLETIVDCYVRADASGRERIREMFRAYRAFAWAASFPFPPDTEERMRKHFILFSIKDQGTDARDAVLSLAELCSATDVPAEVMAAIRREVAELSSDVDRFGFGSTKKLLLKNLS